MATERKPPELVVHIARLYHRGVIYPAETWNQILDATNGLDAVSLFNELDADEQALIRGIHLERPGSLVALADQTLIQNSPRCSTGAIKGNGISNFVQLACGMTRLDPQRRGISYADLRNFYEGGCEFCERQDVCVGLLRFKLRDESVLAT